MKKTKKPEPVTFYEEEHGFGEYQRVYYPGDNRSYTFAELHAKDDVIRTAREMYAKACRAYFKKNGDFGSCVLGNGIYVNVKRPRFKQPFKMMIAHPSGGGQSESAGYSTKDPVIAYLKANGIDAWYDHGRMD